MKVWGKDIKTNQLVEEFTIGNDSEMDHILAKYDVLGSIAHAMMLEKVGLITKKEKDQLTRSLKQINKKIEDGVFTIEQGVEDVHSQIELLLTRELGDTGKKIHTGRSRNDQVLLDIKLYLRDAVKFIVFESIRLFELLQKQSDHHKNILIPGYTHLQVAMPSSFGLWFGAYAESLTDDMIQMLSAYRIINQNPLGSAAGYGSSFPIDRTMTTQLLCFDDLTYNSVYAQMGRGKVEKTFAGAIASVASTLSKFAMDACLFMSQNFGFISFPDEFTTGSSIMPHKKNPDVFELIRAKGNKIKSIPYQIDMITGNLTSGYHRDYQLVKEFVFPAVYELLKMIEAAKLMLENIQVNEDIINDEKYTYIFSVEELNKLVKEGVPFRDAYNKIAETIKNNNFEADRNIEHTHEGSIGNLCNNNISKKMKNIYQEFNFKQIEKAYEELLR